jgi:catechol 2,3-dioxygenase-like lactoylglutathione lyase family enzyme
MLGKTPVQRRDDCVPRVCHVNALRVTTPVRRTGVTVDRRVYPRRVPIEAFDHYTLRCSDLQASWRFYADVLGFRVIEREGVTIPAAIVYLGEMMLIHLFQASDDMQAVFARLEPPDPEAAQWGTGRLHHIAFQASGLEEIRARLRAHGLAFTERTLPAIKHLVLVKDPDNVEIELAFSLDELRAG